MKRTERMNIRVTPVEKRMIEAGARKANVDRSSFLIANSIEMAKTMGITLQKKEHAGQTRFV